MTESNKIRPSYFSHLQSARVAPQRCPIPFEGIEIVKHEIATDNIKIDI